ncbi:MAG: methyltransferase [Nitrososphaerota archaeon]|nr:methyltransferase [Nitrososphaerota archaeon]
MKRVYLPSQDSMLLLRSAETTPFRFVLEIGTGSGFVLGHLVGGRPGSEGVGTDIDVESAQEARDRTDGLRAEVVQCDCAAPFREEAFDLVVVNPPYLEGDSASDPAVYGGEGGVQIPRRMVEDGIRALKVGGSLFFVTSSHSDYGALVRGAASHGEVTGVSEERLFFERLMVYRVVKR